jgi:hypothetical protein
LASARGTVVEHSTIYSKIEGSNPAAGERKYLKKDFVKQTILLTFTLKE